MLKEATKRLEALRRLPAQGDEPLLVDLSWSFPVLTLRRLVVQCVECWLICTLVRLSAAMFLLDVRYNAPMDKKIGNIIIPGDANVWPHEQRTAQSLARAGYTVVFVKKSEDAYATSADVLIDGALREMKAPTSCEIRMVERNLRRAAHQSSNIIFDSRRTKNVPDAAIERELRKWASELNGVSHVLFVNRHGAVIDKNVSCRI